MLQLQHYYNKIGDSLQNLLLVLLKLCVSIWDGLSSFDKYEMGF